MTAPTRPVLRWHGGKWKLAPWIISHFPKHRVYIEPFGGAASVLLRKERSYAEVYNDLDCDVVNLFRVLQDRTSAEYLVRLIELTPFAREEFKLAYAEASEPIERARRLVIRAFMGMGSVSNIAIAGAAGFRNNTERIGTLPAHDWRGYPEALRLVIGRLRGVVIEQRPAEKVMVQHDALDALHYVDPPYMPETRSRLGNRKGSGYIAYAHDLTAEQHRRLLQFLRSLRGMVVLSGYPHPSYDEALPEWRRVTCETHADGARPRTEVLWLNPACAEALDRDLLRGTLFEAAE